MAPPRLIGVETEYALRVRPQKRTARPANAELFARLLLHLRRKIPVAPSIAAPNQEPYAWFTVNGGSVRFERIPILGAVAAKSGVVEGATPECRTARELLLYQRAQDVLLSRAAAASGGDDCEVALLKNNCDGQGGRFACHENYDAEVASGLALLAWRIGLVAVMVPTALVVEVVALFVLLLTAILYFPAYGASLLSPHFLRLWERGTELLIRLIITPFLLPANVFFRLLAFRRPRRELLAFLVTRQVFAGAGAIGPDGRLVLSPRAQTVRSCVSAASESSRPVFLFGHVLKGTSLLFTGYAGCYAQLFRRRQRLQIGVGDSNMAATAEYLKIGATLLVLDAMEAGELDDAPRLRRPLHALRTIARDPELRYAAPVRDGRRLTALEIQRFYWTACRRRLDRRKTGDPEAEEILSLWRETLDDLEHDPRRLFGRVDWVTKRMLLEAGDEPLSVDARRKLDRRYHELSQEGGYLRLEAAGAAPTIVAPEDVLRATQEPPPGGRAWERGRLIREHGAGIRVGWSTVVLRRGAGRAVVSLDDRQATDAAESPEPA